MTDAFFHVEFYGFESAERGTDLKVKKASITKQHEFSINVFFTTQLASQRRNSPFAISEEKKVMFGLLPILVDEFQWR
jgi:hypothetical protein